jgi:hypothetical protein
MVSSKNKKASTQGNSPDTGFQIVVKILWINDGTGIKTDFPGTQFITGRKSVVEPDTAAENFGMMLLVKIDKELADVLPHIPADCGKAFQPFDVLPVRDKEFINLCQG